MKPVVAVFEDLHWNDPLSLGLMNELVVAAQNARLLIIVSYRSDYMDEWRNRPNYRQLRLDPLPSESLGEFFVVLLGSDPESGAVEEPLAKRTSGNPFFIEEMVRSMADTGMLEGVPGNYRLAHPFSDIEIPPTVQAIIAARIDALSAAEKQLLQEAAVIGHDIPFALLRAISRQEESKLRSLLDSLQAARFLYSSQLFPDLQYTFQHALTYDVASSGLLRERRRDIHARVVHAIEDLFADRLGELVERLADHALRGDLKEKAVHYLRQAGVKAAARSAIQEARARFEQALEILKSLPESRTAAEQGFEIRLELRPVLRQLGEVREMLSHLREAEALAEHLKDDRRLGQVCGLMTNVLSTLNELDEAVLTGNRALEIARRDGDLSLSIVAISCLEQAFYYRGEYERVVEIANANLAAMPSEWVNEYFGLAVPVSVFGRGWLIMSLVELGRFAEAARHEAEAMQLAELTQHAHTIGWARSVASMSHFFKGDWAKARQLVEHLTELTLDVAVLLPWTVACSAWALAQLGEFSEALSRVRVGEELLERQAARGIVGHRSWAYYALSRSCLLLGRIRRGATTGPSLDGILSAPAWLCGPCAAFVGRYHPPSGVL